MKTQFPCVGQLSGGLPVVFPLLACVTIVVLVLALLWVPNLGQHATEGWRRCRLLEVMGLRFPPRRVLKGP